ncbi:Rho termination factor, N-terminal domain [[Clostridium] sordellii]|uniref:Rho termination factor N-terminal domain-containing protein n=1 Tax=Paraclostridium sordellii TaxID=1505 RepID=UPI000542003A|nr:Rho termination factor N-terminal domain-containing protein [Paeniclostridium sordellii]CEK35765.1 Rho termination factor, N-terminal domain [[Clostridium] sordellii] [Paeniclostridium sordellii]
MKTEGEDVHTEIDSEESEKLEETLSEEVDLNLITLEELKKIAKDRKIEGYSKLNKHELIERLS